METTEQTHSICIGRHLISLPIDFEQVLPVSATLKIPNRGERATSIEIDVRQTDATAKTFVEAVDKRQGEIIAAATESTDVLKQVIRSEQGDVLFRINRIRDSYSSELHLLSGTSYITLSAKSYHGGYAEVEQKLFGYARAFVSSAMTNPGAPAGFCLGPTVLSGAHEGEVANFLFRSTKRSAIAITVDIDTYARDESPDLLGRVSGPNSLLKIFDARNKVLREGELRVAGMDAQEWLSTVMLGENRDHKQASFVLETMRPHPGPETPRIRIEMNVTGEAAIPSDKQLIHLWDLITKSLRLSGPPPT